MSISPSPMRRGGSSAAHDSMPDDVTLFHAGNDAVVKVDAKAADGGGCDLDGGDPANCAETRNAPGDVRRASRDTRT